MKLQWARAATGDLIRIGRYIGADDPDAAHSTLDRIEGAVETLETFPKRGRVVPELARLGLSRYRELVVTPYRVVYRCDDDYVLVVGVFDSRRDLADLLLERLLEPPG